GRRGGRRGAEMHARTPVPRPRHAPPPRRAERRVKAMARHPMAEGGVDYAQLVARARKPVESVADLVGNTPLLRLHHLEPKPGVQIWGKCEFANPGGSVKDRAALQMVRDALAAGTLTPDKILIDSTSGNTGV